MDTRRALLMTRLSSSDTDDSTSPQRQEEQTTAVATARAWQVVGHAVDLGVSALKTPPLERPELKIWLTEKINEWEILIFWRLDRFVRSAIDMAAMIEWSRKNKKVLVSASEPWFDLSTDVGQALALMVSVFANMEAKATRDRVLDSHKYLRTTPRWAGGPPPYGYMSIPNPDLTEDGRSAGRILVPDPTAVKVINEMFSDAESGKSPNSIYLDLAEKGITSPPDRQRELLGKSLKGAPWSRNAVVRILRNQSLFGYKMRDVVAPDPSRKKQIKVIGRELIRDANGMPVRFADRLVNERQFWNVQRILDERTQVHTRTNNTALLLDVALCSCGRKMHCKPTRARGKLYHYYVCASLATLDSCGSKSYRAEELESFVAEQFLMAAGSIEVSRRVYIPGSTHQDEMEQISSAVAFLTEQQISAGPLQRQVIQSKMATHEARYAVLAALPVVEPHWEVQGLGVTYGERWEAAWNERDTEELRSLLLLSGIRFTLDRRQGTINVSHLASGYLDNKMITGSQSL